MKKSCDKTGFFVSYPFRLPQSRKFAILLSRMPAQAPAKASPNTHNVPLSGTSLKVIMELHM